MGDTVKVNVRCAKSHLKRGSIDMLSTAIGGSMVHDESATEDANPD